jgi:hypothetical protein
MLWKIACDSCRCDFDCPGVRVSRGRVRARTIPELLGTAGRLTHKPSESPILFFPVFYESFMDPPVHWKMRCVLWKDSKGCATMLRFVLRNDEELASPNCPLRHLKIPFVNSQRKH